MDDQLLLYYLSGFPRQLLVASLVFVIPLERREKWPVRLLGVLAGLLGVMGASFVIWHWVNEMIAGQLIFAIYYLMICSTCVIGVHTIFRVSWSEALYCIVCSYIIEHIVYCLSVLLDQSLLVQATINTDVQNLLLYLLIYVPMYFLYARKMCQNGHYASNSVRSVWLMTIVFGLVYVLSVIAIDKQLEWFHAIYALICLNAMLISEYRATRLIQSQEEFQSREHLWEMNKAQYEMTAEHIDTINRKSHDLKHQINALRAIDDQDVRNDVLRSMEEAVMIYDSSYQTGNHTLDMVLTQKALRCDQMNIPLSVIADGKLLDFMDEIDLYTMMANILDNAMEANEQIEASERRSITLTIHEQKGLIILQSENPFVGDIQLKNGLPATRKADKTEHGFGTRSIVYTVEKYDGFLNIETKNQMFVLRIVFTEKEA